MQAVMLQAVGQIRVATVAVPEPKVGELLVKVRSATTCGTDLKAYRRGHPQIPMPGPFGHEYSGVVQGAGLGARFEIGEAVMGVHSAPCQRCRWCLGNQENLCESIMETKVLGSFAEYLLIPARIARLNVYTKPDSLDFDTASLLEPLACVAQGILALHTPVDSALVIGPGAIGLMFVAALRAIGVERVVLAGRNESRLQVGEMLGAEVMKWDLSMRPPDGGFGLVVECTGQVEVWEKSVDLARRGGTVMLFGGPTFGSRASFSTSRIHYDQIALLSPFHFGTDAVRQAYDWLTCATFDLRPLISGSRRLDEAEATFEQLGNGEGIKYAFHP